jgi:hypothetical protein
MRLTSSRTVLSARCVAAAISFIVAPSVNATATRLSAGVRPSVVATCSGSVLGFAPGSTMSTSAATSPMPKPAS